MPIVPTLSIIGSNLVWPAGVCGHSLIDNNRVSHEVRAHNTPMRINNSAIAYSFRMFHELPNGVRIAELSYSIRAPFTIGSTGLIDNNRVNHEVRAHTAHATPMRINNSAIAHSFRMSVPDPLLHYTLGSVLCSDTAISDDCIPYSIATPIVHSFLHTNHCTIISVSHGSIGYSDGSTGYISITPLASVVGLRNLHHCGLWLHLQQ